MISDGSYALRCARDLIGVVEKAGAVAKSSVNGSYDTVDKPYEDVVTSTDEKCESILLDQISSLFPDHSIWSEEAGEMDNGSEWKWIVDPLDGTHNFVSGIPLFGVIVALLKDDVPIAGVIHDSYLGDTVYGAAGGGVWKNGRPLPNLPADVDIRRTTIGWTQGYAVQNDPVARAVRDAAEAEVKRLFISWSPVIDTIRVLSGQFGAIVSFDGEVSDLSAARVLVPELGGGVAQYSSKGENRRYIVGHTGVVEQLTAAVEAVTGV